MKHKEENIPDQWENYCLNDLGIITMGHSPKGITCNRSGEGYPLLNGAVDLSSDGIKVSQFTTEMTRKAKKGDLLFCIRATIGNLATAEQEYCIGRGVASLSVWDKFDKSFIGYILEAHFQKMRNASQGGVIKGLTKDELEKFSVTIPSQKFEQRKIAEILEAVDESISKTQEVIDATEKLKKGLMQQLFTRGIGHTKFKQTSLGEIPDHWSIEELGDLVDVFDNERIPLSRAQRNKMKSGALYPYYGAAKVIDCINDYIFDGEYLLFAEDGTVEKNGCPILQLANGKFWVNNHAHVLKTKPPLTNTILYYMLLQKNITPIITGSNQLKINQNNLLSLQIAIPSPEEQKKNVRILKLLDANISKQQAIIEKIKKVKEGLMQDLLTGNRRIEL